MTNIKKLSVLSAGNMMLKGGSQYLIIFLFLQGLGVEAVGEYKAFSNLAIALWVFGKLGLDQTFYRWASSDWNTHEITLVSQFILILRVSMVALILLYCAVNFENKVIIFIGSYTSCMLIRSFYTEAYFPALKEFNKSVIYTLAYQTLLISIITLTVFYLHKDIFLILALFEIVFVASLVYVNRTMFSQTLQIAAGYRILVKNKACRNFIIYTFISSIGSVSTYKLLELYFIGETLNYETSGQVVLLSTIVFLFANVCPANIMRSFILPYLKDDRQGSSLIQKLFLINTVYGVLIALLLVSSSVTFILEMYLKLSDELIKLFPILVLHGFISLQNSFVSIILLKTGKLRTTLHMAIGMLICYALGPFILKNYGIMEFLALPVLVISFGLLLYCHVISNLGYKSISQKIIIMVFVMPVILLF